MKHLTLVLTLFLFSFSLIGQSKKVAMLKPIASAEVSEIVKTMVRGELTKSLSKESGFEAFTRTELDEIIKELKLQESGMFNDEQRIKLGQLTGADYICISKITKDGDSYYLQAFLVHLGSGKINNPATAFVEGGYASVNVACQKIAGEMVGKKVDVEMPDSREKTNQSKKKKTKNIYPKAFKNEQCLFNITKCVHMGNVLEIHGLVQNKGNETVGLRLTWSTNGYDMGEHVEAFTNTGLSYEVDRIYLSNEKAGIHRSGAFKELPPGATVQFRYEFDGVSSDLETITGITIGTFVAGDRHSRRSHSFRNLPVTDE